MTSLETTQGMSFAEAFAVSVLGFAIVFFVLVVLMLVIRLMRSVLDSMEAAPPAAAVTDAPAAPAAPAGPPPGMIPAKGSLGEVKLYDVDDKTAALIMAIVADEMQAPLNELRFLSIREKI